MSLKKTYLSEHFTREELACKCGCGQDTVDSKLIELCEVVRALNGNIPITPSSGNRCATHNKKIGGNRYSQHQHSRAADLPVNDPVYVYQQLCKKYPGQYGFGLYNNRVHVDSRSSRAARWVG